MRTVIWFGIITAYGMALDIYGIKIPDQTMSDYAKLAGIIFFIALFLDIWTAINARD
jgi:hypothetical protein